MYKDIRRNAEKAISHKFEGVEIVTKLLSRAVYSIQKHGIYETLKKKSRTIKCLWFIKTVL